MKFDAPAGAKLLAIQRAAKFAKLTRQVKRAIARKSGCVFRAEDRCPKCGAAAVFSGPRLEDGSELDSCVVCSSCWERETRFNPTSERCNNCAFRPGSPEQNDPERWRTVVEETVRKHGVFFCHKRVPASIDKTIADGVMDYQMARDSTGYITNAPPCAGWVAARISQIEKKVGLTLDQACDLPRPPAPQASEPPASGTMTKGG